MAERWGDVILGVDIGGECVDIGLVSHTGHVVSSQIIATQAEDGPDECVKRIAETARELSHLATGSHMRGIGIGAPGPLDLVKGTMISPPNLPPSWWDYPIQDAISDSLQSEASLDNDGNAATLAEGWVGAAQEAQNFLVLTLGMGVGGGVMVERNIMRGAAGCAGELGHICVFPDGLPCGCGRQGCLEAYASAKGIVKQYAALASSPQNLSAKEVLELAKVGDPIANQVVTTAGQALGIAIGSLENIFNPERIIFVGRIAAYYDLFRKAIEECVRTHAFPTAVDRADIRVSPLAEKNGIIGAAAVYAYNRRSIYNIRTAHLDSNTVYPVVVGHVGVTGMRFGIVGMKDGLNTYELKVKKREPGKAETTDELLTRTAAGIAEVVKTAGLSIKDVKGVSITTPGTIDRQRKEIIFSPNMPWANVRIEEELRARLLDLNADIYLERDAFALALAEQLFGQGRELRNFGVIYLGTGLGVGLVLNGKQYRGQSGYAGEIGHTTIDCMGAKNCMCGGSGCLECFASGRALCGYAISYINRGWVTSLSAVERLGGQIAYFDVLKAADEGDAVAKMAFQEMGQRLAIGMRNLFNTLDLQRVVISGPLARGGRHFLSVVQQTLAGMPIMPQNWTEQHIAVTSIEDNELAGAVASFVDQVNPKGWAKP